MATIRPIRPSDLGEVVRMRTVLWPDGSDEHLVEVQRLLNGEPMGGNDYQAQFPRAIIVAERDRAGLCGFVELGVRSVAEGCYDGNPVGYIEGWYVDSDMRRMGIGSGLVSAAESWARAQGCTEMASDSLLNNETSIVAHKALGYGEVERAVHFRKSLKD